MKYTYIPSEERVREAMQQDEPMLAAITFDGEQAILSPIDDSMEHHIMLMNAGKKSTDIDQYFRIIKAFHGKINELNDSIRMVLL